VNESVPSSVSFTSDLFFDGYKTALPAAVSRNSSQTIFVPLSLSEVESKKKHFTGAIAFGCDGAAPPGEVSGCEASAVDGVPPADRAHAPVMEIAASAIK